MPNPELSVLIVNYNAARMLPNCLASLPAGAGALAIETIVVDNASSDESVALIRAQFPTVHLIVNAQNVGFAAANNQAAAVACGRYVLLLNPDTVVQPGALETMVRYFDEHPTLGALGPRLLNPNGTLQRSCGRNYPGLRTALSDALYLWKLPGLPMARATEYPPSELKRPRHVDHLLGAVMLIPRNLWQQLGGLDDRFFLFLEETDWCFRARLHDRGSLYLPTATVIHKGQHSMDQNPRRNLPQFYRSYCLFYRKHRSPSRFRQALLKFIIALAALIRLGLWRFRQLRRQGADREHARAMQAGYGQVLAELGSF